MQEDDSLDTVTFDYKAMDDLQYYLSDSIEMLIPSLVGPYGRAQE